MREMAALGRDTRARYVNELELFSGHYDDREVYVYSSDAQRCMQSASAFGVGLFPDGTGPAGFLSTRPTLLPVNVLASLRSHCRLRIKANSIEWFDRTGRRLIAEHAKTVRRMERLCGFNFTSMYGASGERQSAPLPVHEPMPTHDAPTDEAELAHSGATVATHTERLPVSTGKAVQNHHQSLTDYSGDLPTAIKDIADALVFDRLQRLPPGMPGLGDADWTTIRDLAFRLFFSHFFSRDDQVVDMSCKLPSRILQNFDSVLNGLPNKARKLFAYHTHRDMLYSFAAFFGISFDGPGVTHVPGVPQGFIPPATALFIELHDNAPEDGNASSSSSTESPKQHFVRVFLWLPCNETASPADLSYASLAQGSCPFTQVTLDGCARDCPLSHLVAIAQRRQARVGGRKKKKLYSRLARDSLQELVDSSAATAATRFSRAHQGRVSASRDQHAVVEAEEQH